MYDRDDNLQLMKVSQLNIIFILQSLETFDNGMPIGLSVGTVYAAAKQLRYLAGWADKIQGKTIPIGNVV